MQRKEIDKILAGAVLKGVGVSENQGKVSSIVLHLQDGQKISFGDVTGPELPVRLLEPEQQEEFCCHFDDSTFKAIADDVMNATSMEELRQIETDVFGDSPIPADKNERI